MMRSTYRGRLLAAACAVTALAAGPAGLAVAQEGAETIQEDAAAAIAQMRAELAEQRALIEAQQSQLNEQQRELALHRQVIQQQNQVIRQLAGGEAQGQAQAQGAPAPSAPPATTAPRAPGAQAQTAPQAPQARTAPRPPGAAASRPVPPGQSAQAQTPAPEPQPQPEQTAPAAQGPADDERPESERQVDQLLVDQGGVLLPPGTMQIESAIEYSAITGDEVNISGFSIFDAILIGSVSVDEIERDIITPSLSARYGLFRRVQIEGRLPYVYRRDTNLSGVGTGDPIYRRFDGRGFGDVSGSVSWQPLAAEGWRPATIVRAGVTAPTGKSAFEIPRIALEEDGPETELLEAPTGSGFYTANLGATFVWTSDQVVLYAGAGYTYAHPNSFDGFGEVNPGDGLDWSLGVNLSLNDRMSTSFSFQNQRRFSSQLEGSDILGSASNDARLSVGSSLQLTDRVSLVSQVQVGATDDAPDFAFSLRVPITLQTGLNRSIGGLFRGGDDN
jgi:TolA-binding protein